MVDVFTVLIVVTQSVCDMEIKTKYNIGDKVYTLHKNKITKVKIKAVNCALSNTERYIGYATDIVEGLFNSNKVFTEKELFKTKEELLESL